VRSIQQASIVFVVAVAPLFGQDALPVGAPVEFSEPLVVLESEPTREVPAATLASAAHANDFATFDTLFRANESEAYRPLHELWTYSVTDPIGAFYGPELFERFARAYPGFAESMSQYRIIDSRGNAFYPSSETRTFLLAQAEQGRVAELARRVLETPRRARSERTARLVPAESRRIGRQEAAPAVPSAPPVPLEPLPVVIAATPAVVIRPEPLTTPAAPPAATSTDSRGSARGLLLVIIGLLGTGVLALIVRAPREVPSVTPRRDP
jgi:hypothetical protein